MACERWLIVAAACAAPFASAAQTTRAPDNYRELFAYLRQCVRLPPGSEGSEITLRFSLTPAGALRGKPAIAYSRLTGDAAAQRLFVASVLSGLETCLPAPVTEGFGRIVSQRVIA